MTRRPSTAEDRAALEAPATCRKMSKTSVRFAWHCYAYVSA